MRGWYSPPEYNGYDYVQDTEPTPPLDPILVEGRTWYDNGDNKAYVYDGANWVDLSVTSHGNLTGVTASQHHTKTTEASELTDVSPDSDNNAHHSQNHDNTDHTTDYHPTDDYTPEADTHDKTTTASELTDVSPDSDNNAHHSQSHDNTDHTTNYLPDSDYTPETDTHDRYTDSEVSSAAPVQSVNNQTGDVTISDSGMTYNIWTDGHTSSNGDDTWQGTGILLNIDLSIIDDIKGGISVNRLGGAYVGGRLASPNDAQTDVLASQYNNSGGSDTGTLDVSDKDTVISFEIYSRCESDGEVEITRAEIAPNTTLL